MCIRDRDYTALENELAQTVANIESTHPGYDEYRYSVDEIGHNPYELASYLSAKYHVYFREQVQDELREIFEAQYELTLTEEVEIRYRTETSTDPETGETTTEEVPYEYYILNVTLTNKTLPAVILPRLDEQQREIYTVMQQLKGNKPYLWEGIYNGGEDTGPSYEIPVEALDDPAFAAPVSYTHLIQNGTEITPDVLDSLRTELEAMELGPLFGLWLQSFLIQLTMIALNIVIFVIVYGRMIEIYLLTSLAPIPFATVPNRETGHMGQNYFRSLFAVGFQGLLILVCVAIYAVLIQSIATDGDPIGAIWGCVGYTVLLCFTLFKTGSLAKSIFGCH